MYGSFRDRGRFMKNFHFNTICNISTQDSGTTTITEIYKMCLCVHRQVCCDKIPSIVNSKIIYGKLRFDQLATSSSSASP